MKYQNDENSLRKSHSKWSNFKLTLVNLIGIIGISGLWISLIYSVTLYIIIFILISVIYILLINLFKR